MGDPGPGALKGIRIKAVLGILSRNIITDLPHVNLSSV